MEAILDEAMGIVSAEGLEALTLQRLAVALRCVPAALYRYFDSKDALVAALQRRAIAEVHGRLSRAAVHASELTAGAAADVTALARIACTARAYLDLPRTNPQAAFLLALLVGDPRQLVSDAEAARAAPPLLALLGDVAAMFRDAVASGALEAGDATERTLAFWATLQGALSLEKARRVAPAMPSARRVGAAALSAMLLGWGADERTAAKAARLLDLDDGARSPTPTTASSSRQTDTKPKRGRR